MQSLLGFQVLPVCAGNLIAAVLRRADAAGTTQVHKVSRKGALLCLCYFMQDDFSQQCLDMLARLEGLRMSDWRLDNALSAACNDDVATICAAQLQTSGQQVSSWVVLWCIVLLYHVQCVTQNAVTMTSTTRGRRTYPVPAGENPLRNNRDRHFQLHRTHFAYIPRL